MELSITDLLFSIKADLDELERQSVTKIDVILQDYTFTEMHCILGIHNIKDANVTKLANAMNITKGGVSKIIKRLLKRGSIEIYTSQSNKKEVYYRLTNIGKEVYLAHETMHQNWYKQDAEFFSQFNKKDLLCVCEILSQYNGRLKRQLSNLEGDL